MPFVLTQCKVKRTVLQGLTFTRRFLTAAVSSWAHWTCAQHLFTGEQVGKYGGVKEALGNGYKGEDIGLFIIHLQRSSESITNYWKVHRGRKQAVLCLQWIKFEKIMKTSFHLNQKSPAYKIHLCWILWDLIDTHHTFVSLFIVFVFVPSCPLCLCLQPG